MTAVVVCPSPRPLGPEGPAPRVMTVGEQSFTGRPHPGSALTGLGEADGAEPRGRPGPCHQPGLCACGSGPLSSRARQDVETVVRSALELNSGISNCLENTGSAYRWTRLVLSGRSAVPMTAERPGLQPPAGFGSGHKGHQRPGVGAVAMGAAPRPAWQLRDVCGSRHQTWFCSALWQAE